jgi:hypothetical protein
VRLAEACERPETPRADPGDVYALIDARHGGAVSRARAGRELGVQVEWWAEVAVEQVPVGLEREGGRVVAHPALQSQRWLRPDSINIDAHV